MLNKAISLDSFVVKIEQTFQQQQKTPLQFIQFCGAWNIVEFEEEYQITKNGSIRFKGNKTSHIVNYLFRLATILIETRMIEQILYV